MITEIKGLENLANLKSLDLRGNQIRDIKGLENLSNLEDIYIEYNPLQPADSIFYDLHKRFPSQGCHAQPIVEHCKAKKEGKIPFVTFEGTDYYLYGDDSSILSLSDLGITDITDIEGLEDLTQLQTLSLSFNQIEEIKGLEHLTNLRELWLDENPIKEDERYLLRIARRSPQEVVKYCQEKTKKLKEVG